ncbi:MAG: aminotransferase class IV [Candidatus Aminicenantia bacterium]
MIVYNNGQFCKFEETRAPLNQSYFFGDGVFTTLKTYGGKAFELRKHIDRLFESASLIDLPLPVEKNYIKELIEAVLQKNLNRDCVIRIIISRETDLSRLKKGKPYILIIPVEPIKYDQENYKRGVKVITFRGERYLPRAKSLNYLVSVIAGREADKKGANEALLVDRNDYVREGSISNFFIVKNNTLITPNDEILFGVTREVVLDIARKNWKIELRDIKKFELFEADEVFLTGTTKEVMPVVEIDGKKIGEGKVGDITKRLIVEFQNYVEEEIQKI